MLCYAIWTGVLDGNLHFALWKIRSFAFLCFFFFLYPVMSVSLCEFVCFFFSCIHFILWMSLVFWFWWMEKNHELDSGNMKFVFFKHYRGWMNRISSYLITCGNSQVFGPFVIFWSLPIVVSPVWLLITHFSNKWIAKNSLRYIVLLVRPCIPKFSSTLNGLTLSNSTALKLYFKLVHQCLNSFANLTLSGGSL